MTVNESETTSEFLDVDATAIHLTNNVSATVKYTCGFRCCDLAITTTDGHRGTGEGIGSSACESLDNGILSFNSWEQMMSGTNDWQTKIEGQNILILFTREGKPVAQFVGPNEGFPRAEGQMVWSVV